MMRATWIAPALWALWALWTSIFSFPQRNRFKRNDPREIPSPVMGHTRGDSMQLPRWWMGSKSAQARIGEKIDTIRICVESPTFFSNPDRTQALLKKYVLDAFGRQKNGVYSSRSHRAKWCPLYCKDAAQEGKSKKKPPTKQSFVSFFVTDVSV